MIILGIDPGPKKSAYVAWDFNKEKILQKNILTNKDFFQELDYLNKPYFFYQGNAEEISYYKAGQLIAIDNLNDITFPPLGKYLLAIEVPLIFGNKVWQQVIDTSFIAGQITGISNLPYKKVAPNEWKLHIAGKRGANDQLVKQALMARFGPKGTKKNPGKLYGLKTHLWDALGIAVYVGDTINET